ncbi:MAG: ABC transporter permease subunit [Acidobacteriota bacterium]
MTSNLTPHTPSSPSRSANFRLLVAKECRHVLFSPKFVAAGLVVTVVVLLAVLLGLREHADFADRQHAAEQWLVEQQAQATDWMGLRHRAFRDADPMQIFVSGVHRDLGRHAPIRGGVEPALEHSIYGDEPIFAIFRTFDLAFVVTVVLSLFAIVFTYDALCGEREAGTLRLLTSHAVPRTVVVGAKAVGLWLALMVPMLLAALLGLAVVLASGVALDPDTWTRRGVLCAAAALYATVFTFLGVAASTLTRRATTSFLGLLAFWVLVVLVWPRAALVVAVQQVPVPSAAEVDARLQGFENRAWEDNMRAMGERWQGRSAQMEGMDEAARQEFEDANTWTWIEEDDAARQTTEAEIRAYGDRLRETVVARRQAQRRVALNLSRLSPASAFQLIAVATAGTGVDLSERWQDALRRYRDEHVDWVRTAGGESGTHSVRRSGGGGTFGDTGQTLDLGGMPRFVPPRPELSTALAEVPFDVGLLLIEALLALAVALFAFQRYDVR